MNQAEIIEQQEEAPAPVELSADEEKARSNGWTGKAEWIESGKPEDDWINYKHFNKVGDLISNNNKIKRDVDKRLHENNEFHKQNLKSPN